MFKQLSESLARFAEQQQEIDDQLDAFVLRHGWPIPLDLPIRAYARVVKMADRIHVLSLGRITASGGREDFQGDLHEQVRQWLGLDF